MLFIKRRTALGLMALLLAGLAGCTTPEQPGDVSTTATAVTSSPAALATQAETPFVAEATAPSVAEATATTAARATPSRTAGDSPTAPLQPEPAATATATPPTPSPTVTPIPTSAEVDGWLVYENDFLGYRFSYPPGARIRVQGFTGFPMDELPENLTVEEYQAQLEAEYPDNLCVTVSYEAVFIAFVPSYDTVGKYTVPCGVTGVGDFEIRTEEVSLIIDGRQMVGSIHREFGGEGNWRGEFTLLGDGNDLGIHYGSTNDATHEEFLDAQETMMQIVLSLRLD